MKFFVFFAALISLPAMAATHTLTQKGKQFSEATLTVKAGDKIVFKNDDDTAHNVFSSSAGNAFNLKIQKPATESEYTFATPGEVDVRCAIHPKMQLKVKVEP